MVKGKGKDKTFTREIFAFSIHRVELLVCPLLWYTSSRWPSGDGKLVLDHVEVISARRQVPRFLILVWLFPRNNTSSSLVSFSFPCAWVCEHARSASLEEEEEGEEEEEERRRRRRQRQRRQRQR